MKEQTELFKLDTSLPIEDIVKLPEGTIDELQPFESVDKIEYRHITLQAYDGMNNHHLDEMGFLNLNKKHTGEEVMNSRGFYTAKMVKSADITGQQFIQLQVLGEPTAQKRHRSVRMGKFNRQYDPSAADKGDFLSIVQKYAPETPYAVPLQLDLRFYFTRPKSHYKSGKNAHLLKDNPPEYHTSRPDADNLIKFVMDALNKIYWKDDSYIVSLNIQKMYSENPRTEIELTIL